MILSSSTASGSPQHTMTPLLFAVCEWEQWIDLTKEPGMKTPVLKKVVDFYVSMGVGRRGSLDLAFESCQKYSVEIVSLDSIY
jgi:hypothetical protein